MSVSVLLISVLFVGTESLDVASTGSHAHPTFWNPISTRNNANGIPTAQMDGPSSISVSPSASPTLLNPTPHAINFPTSTFRPTVTTSGFPTPAPSPSLSLKPTILTTPNRTFFCNRAQQVLSNTIPLKDGLKGMTGEILSTNPHVLLNEVFTTASP